MTIAQLETGQTIAFIARHGVGHSLLPTEVPCKSNIAALKHLGVEAIVAFSAVGSLREDIKPRDVVIPSQIIDRTKARPEPVMDAMGFQHNPANFDSYPDYRESDRRHTSAAALWLMPCLASECGMIPVHRH